MTNMLKGKKKRKIQFTAEVHAAFTNLKQRFISTPILKAPEPTKHFVVEVDALEVGVGAVLSPKQGNPEKLHPCTFFSCKLTPAGVNYDIGNWELLAVKATIEEWRHWLEGTLHPFTYLLITEILNTSGRRLNSRQAHWSLFFTHFHFTIFYHPGSKNTKADALSQQHTSPEPDPSPEPIIPSCTVVAPMRWDVDVDIARKIQGKLAPQGCLAR